MAKAKTQFVCGSCGASHPKWMGKCGECGTWNTLLEQAVLPPRGPYSVSAGVRSPTVPIPGPPRMAGLAGAPGSGSAKMPWAPGAADAPLSPGAADAPLSPGAADAPLSQGTFGAAGASAPAGRRRLASVHVPEVALRSQPIISVDTRADAQAERLRSGLPGVDRVLGGGLVPGSLVLLGGDPGIGKSTLLLQMMQGFSRQEGKDAQVLYVSGEESMAQSALRARRLEITRPGVRILSENRLEAILDEAGRLSPRVLAIDSIQTVLVDGVVGVPGSVSQVREAAARMMPFAKERDIATILIGHVTKEGSLAGPKTLEHLVDAVILFEGERGHPYRILRSSKNRFGATSEIGVFEMRGEGLFEVNDPSALFLSERPLGVPGSAVTAAMEGSLPLLLEVQALVAHAIGVPRRTAIGVDPYRLAMLLAVIERRVGMDVLGQDVFVNVAGGIRLEETAADLAVAVAVASSIAGREVDGSAVCFGEVGLSGEIRAVPQAEVRIKEAGKLGFRRCVLPEASAKQVRKLLPGSLGSIELVGVRDLSSAIDALLLERGARSPAGPGSR